MEKITFKNLHHISELDEISKKIKASGNAKNPGIYIWGFVTNKQISEILKIEDTKFDGSNMKFIPYYVGLDSNLFDRIKKHKNFVKSDATKYTRLTTDYLKKFFMDDYFQINDKKIDVKDVIINKGIEYYNHPNFLKNKIIEKNDIEKITNDNNNPITRFKSVKDTLIELYNEGNKINHLNNLWFCYALLNGNKDFLNCKLEDFEALTFYSLKGKTISKTKKIKDISSNIQICFEGNELENIFKRNNINKSIIESDFTFNNQIEFLGY